MWATEEKRGTGDFEREPIYCYLFQNKLNNWIYFNVIIMFCVYACVRAEKTALNASVNAEIQTKTLYARISSRNLINRILRCRMCGRIDAIS